MPRRLGTATSPWSTTAVPLVGKWFSDHGIAAFILEYRLAKAEGSPYTVERESLMDAQRAVRTVRSRAKEWGVNPAAVGIMGFSAGGEVACPMHPLRHSRCRLA